MADIVPSTHKYIPRVEQRQNNLFLEEYYSSTDTKITIKGEEQKEVAYISYSVQEQLKPLYGYASNTYDDMAVGNRIVTGTLKISLKNPERQDTLEEVKSKIQDYYSDYNQREEYKRLAKEWLFPLKDGTTITEEKFDELMEIAEKLMELGYTIKAGMAYGDIIAAIRQFQKDNGLGDFSGVVTDELVSAINEALEALRKKEYRDVMPGQQIFAGPGEEYGTIFQFYSPQKIEIISKTEGGGWCLVKTADGTTGYMQIAEV